jgi:hypothetical protein
MPKPSTEALETLNTQRSRVNCAWSADRVWNRFLSDEDRKKLGDNLDSAYSDHHGLIGMWIKIRKVSVAQATIDLGFLLGFIDQPTKNWLLQEFGEITASEAHQADLPVWNRERGELSCGGKVIRKIRKRNQAKNIVKVLDAFQEEGWPHRIDDPLPNGPDGARVNQTRDSLNQNLQVIRFHGDGTGQGFTWDYV